MFETHVCLFTHLVVVACSQSCRAVVFAVETGRSFLTPLSFARMWVYLPLYFSYFVWCLLHARGLLSIHAPGAWRHGGWGRAGPGGGRPGPGPPSDLVPCRLFGGLVAPTLSYPAPTHPRTHAPSWSIMHPSELLFHRCQAHDLKGGARLDGPSCFS